MSGPKYVSNSRPWNDVHLIPSYTVIVLHDFCVYEYIGWFMLSSSFTYMLWLLKLQYNKIFQPLLKDIFQNIKSALECYKMPLSNTTVVWWVLTQHYKLLLLPELAYPLYRMYRYKFYFTSQTSNKILNLGSFFILSSLTQCNLPPKFCILFPCYGTFHQITSYYD